MTALRIETDGDLGTALANHLTTLLSPHPSSHDVAVRASWRDVPGEFERFAAAATVPWLGIAFRHPAIRVGPLVVPGVPPCHGCFLARVRQHRSDSWADRIDEAYAADLRLGVTGFPSWAVSIAAGQALALLAGMTTGEVRMVDCSTGEVEQWHVVPTHDCATCGRQSVGLEGLRAVALGRADEAVRHGR